jgi:hypothetical protein
MTKRTALEELREAIDSIKGDTPYERGEKAGLELAYSYLREVRTTARKIPNTVEVRLTPEQCRRIDALLTNGPLDRLIRGKIGRSLEELR